MRLECGCVLGLVLLITTRFGRISSWNDGNSEEMALKQIALTLLALFGLVTVGNGKFQLSTSPAFVSMCFLGLGIACCRSSSWRSLSRIWLTVSRQRRPQNDDRCLPEPRVTIVFVCGRL